MSASSSYEQEWIERMNATLPSLEPISFLDRLAVGFPALFPNRIRRMEENEEAARVRFLESRRALHIELMEHLRDRYS